MALSFLALGARHAWLLDLLSFARQHLLVLAVASAALAFLAGARGWALAAAVAAVVNAAPSLQQREAAPSPTEAVPLRVLSFNVMNQNYYANRVERFLRRSGADLVVLQEMTPFVGGKLEALRGLYLDIWPDLSLPKGDLAVLSRRPLRSVEILEPPPEAAGEPWERPLRLELEGGAAVYAVHPDTPRSPERWRRRNALLAWLGETARARDGDRPRIMVGDFNTPPGSPFLADLKRAARVRDAAGGGLRHPTRQPLLLAPYLSWLGAPVDHVLVSPGIGVRAFWVARDVESDHLPVVADLLLPGAGQPALASPAR